jgi:hypothetical protein
VTRTLLKKAFEEASHNNQVLTPDRAIEKMHEGIRRLAGPQEEVAEVQGVPADFRRLNLVRLERDAHHYAVDLYYDNFSPRKGAPSLRPEYRAHLLNLRSQGLSVRQIAIKVGLGSSKESQDRVSKQLRIAKAKLGKK